MKTKQQPIKAGTSYRRMTAEVVVSTSNAIQAHFDNNPHLTGAPPLPVDLPTVKTATDLLSAKIAAAADGSTTAIAERNHQKEVVIGLLEQLAHYAEANCKGDVTIFLSFGFTPKASSKKKAPPVSETVRRIEPGAKSGEMKVWPTSYPGAGSYEIRCAPAVPGGTPTSWTNKGTTSVRSATIINGLMPGTTYVFQVRAVTSTGYSDWGEPVTRIAV